MDLNIDTLVEQQMEKIAPLLAKVSLPVDGQGCVPPQALAQMIAQVLVAQRFMQVQLELEVLKLDRVATYTRNYTYPTMAETDEHLQEMREYWHDNLCKYLHRQLEHKTQEMIKALQEANKEQSRIITPSNNVRTGIVRPQ